MNLPRCKASASLLASVLVILLIPVVASAQWVSGAGTQTTSNNVGIGVTPGLPLEIQKGGVLLSGNFVYNMRTGDATGSRGFVLGYDNSGAIGVLAAVGVNGQLAFWNHNGTAWGERMRLDNLGHLGIGTSAPAAMLDVNGDTNITGNIAVSGNIAAKYQDFAEWVPASSEISPGTVVIVDEALKNHVIPSAEPYDTRVAGVISAKPGVILGEATAGSVQVATSGRVRVHVDATGAPIHVGDLLVTSSREGTAMASRPINVGGMKIHRPGTIVGKALEPLSTGTGEILVLLTLQ